MRSVRVRSSPSVCGPRSISTASSARGRVSRPQCLVEGVAVAKGGASVRGVDEPRQAPGLDTRHGGFGGALVVGDDRIAVRRLAARQGQGVERERVLLGGRELFLHQAPEHPDLGGGEVHRDRAYGPPGGIVGARGRL